MARSLVRGNSVLGSVMTRSFAPVFAVYVFLLVLLPSGSLFGINVKILCFAWLIGPALYWFLKDPETSPGQVALLLAVPAGLALWVVLGQVYTIDLALSASEYKDIWTTLASCWLAAVYFRRDQSRSIHFLRLILYAESLASLLKLVLLAYCFVKGVPVSVMVDAINAFFNVDLMGMDFESALGRIQFTADGLIPVCLYLLLRYRSRLRVGVPFALLLFVLLSLSLIFTFSRYFWAFGIAALVVGVLFSNKDRFHSWLLILTCGAVLAALPALISLYELRTSAAVAGDSDSVRTLQIPALQRYFLEAPTLGHGLGSHPTDVIRNVTFPYVYEVQLYALAGQIGLVGIALLALPTVVYFMPLWPLTWRSLSRKGSLLLLLLLWLLAGLFNPMLLNSAAAMSYAAFRALAFVEEAEPADRKRTPLSRMKRPDGGLGSLSLKRV